VIIAVFVAYVSVRRRNALTGTLDTLTMVPYIVPGLVIGIAFLLSFNRTPLLLTGTAVIMILALVMRRLPYTIRSSSAILYQISPSVEEASISLGASHLKTFFRVTIPMMGPGVISGGILTWVAIITELSATIFLYTVHTETLSISIYTEVIRGQYGVAAALSTILTVMTVLSLFIFLRINRDKEISI
jgi:iron(III) transport system permease protein